MEIFELTKQSKSPYPFAEKQTSGKDLVKTERLLKKVFTYLGDFLTVETPPSSVSFLSQKKRTCRIIIYDFKKLLSQTNIFIVIFYGNKRDNLLFESTNTFFNTDWEIAMSMVGSNNILCYASQELSDGNWFNIVLFTEQSATLDVLAKEKHMYASRVLAPKRFSWVRLHNASLPKGIKEYSNISFQTTKYYNFDTMWFAKRKYQ